MADRRADPPWLAEAIELRTSGKTFEWIGGRFGYSGVQVRRILEEHGVSGRVVLVPVDVPAGWLPPNSFRGGYIHQRTIWRWARLGKIESIQLNGHWYVREQEVLDRVLKLLERECAWPGCKQPVGSSNRLHRYCTEHTKDRDTTPERLAVKAARQERWRTDHPEANQAIQDRAVAVRREKRREARRKGLPRGTY